ncbi:AAA family ATPase [Pasteurella oralis]|uniref:AAA family ATPase n=1 Tax=Pasteurella oralis TaxID=1071947 RepID=UPI000C7B55ED|nr:AAA family ATPase [Pasteurella oralis]
MIIDLAGNDLFNSNEIKFDQKVNFIFGKNGCGKSTITKLVKEQCNNYDVRIFQGFESVVSANNSLETVVLGEENTDINNKIEENRREIIRIEQNIISIKNNILENEEYPDNLWSKRDLKEKKYKAQKDKIDNFCRESAKKIKEDEQKITSSSYNITSFKEDIPQAKSLSEDRVSELRKLLKSEVKTANKLEILNFSLSDELNYVNRLLRLKVEERTRLVRLEGDHRKKAFAEQGLHIHKAGDVCAFCNNPVSEDVIEELQKYFEADEVKEFNSNIDNKINNIDKLIQNINSMKIDVDNFYVDYQSKIEDIRIEFDRLKNEYVAFLNKLASSLREKKSNLFQESSLLQIKSPDEINDVINQYNDIVDENNDSDLPKKKEKAKSDLRFHLVSKFLSEFKYDIQYTELISLSESLREVNNDIDKEESKIEIFNKEIKYIESTISDLLASTKNEKILVQRVNKKLKLYVNFELIHQDGSNDYKVKCSRNGSIRTVHELSTGEKNIIAFLYFIEKINDSLNSRSKCIVFDDPMNSNDDTVQYLIIEELQKLKDKKITDNEKIIILTHNIHFYLNVKFGFSYKDNNFYHLVRNGKNIILNKIHKKEDDFDTSYSALWKELKILYDKDDISENMLLNPIRRIIETYTKFNGISKDKFFQKVVGAKKLFNVNSHSIDDLESDLNGKNKQEIIALLQECFEQNDAIEHYNQFFGDN